MAVFITGGQARERVNYVGWLRSEGNAYVNTEYKTKSNNIRVVVKFKYNTSDTARSIFGAQNGDGTLCGVIPYRGSANNTALYIAQTHAPVSVSVSTGTVNEWDIAASGGTVTWKSGDTTKTASYSGVPNQNYTYLLFANNVGGTADQFCTADLEFYQMYDNDVLVRDMWPCYDPDGIPAMYDRVEKKYHYNQGSGEFIAGGETNGGDSGEISFSVNGETFKAEQGMTWAQFINSNYNTGDFGTAMGSVRYGIYAVKDSAGNVVYSDATIISGYAYTAS